LIPQFGIDPGAGAIEARRPLPLPPSGLFPVGHAGRQARRRAGRPCWRCWRAAGDRFPRRRGVDLPRAARATGALLDSPHHSHRMSPHRTCSTHGGASLAPDAPGLFRRRSPRT